VGVGGGRGKRRKGIEVMGLGWREKGVCDEHDLAFEDVLELDNSKLRQQCRGRREKGGAPLGGRLLCLREGS